MRLSSVLVAGLLIWGASSAPAASQQYGGAGPSFDCSTARAGAEQAICVYPDLAQLDRVMADLYEKVRAARTGAASQALIAEQRRWLNDRNACGSDHGCLARVHNERIQQLRPGHATVPAPPPPAKGVEATQFVVIVPELNVFPQPSVRSDRVGALYQGDGVVVERWQDDSKGEKWARVCAKRLCGWVAAEFLQIAPSGADDVSEPMPPHAGAPPTDSGHKTESSPSPLEQLPDIEGLERLQ